MLPTVPWYLKKLYASWYSLVLPQSRVDSVINPLLVLSLYVLSNNKNLGIDVDDAGARRTYADRWFVEISVDDSFMKSRLNGW